MDNDPKPDWTDLMFAAEAFEANPTEENLIRLNEAREAVIRTLSPPTWH